MSILGRGAVILAAKYNNKHAKHPDDSSIGAPIHNTWVF